MDFALNSLKSAASITDDEIMHASGVVPAYVAVDISMPDFHDLAIWRTGHRCFVIATKAGHFSRSQCGYGGSDMPEELRDDGALGMGVHIRRARESKRTAKAVELTDASMTTMMDLAA
jgi:hypothetical protein